VSGVVSFVVSLVALLIANWVCGLAKPKRQTVAVRKYKKITEEEITEEIHIDE
jgi:hypothetical protein